MANVAPVSIVNLNGVAATASANGAAVWAGNLRRVSFVATISGATSPVATVILQGSNDSSAGPNDPTFEPTNWDTVRAITGTVTASFTDNGTLASPSIDISYRYIRAVYTYSSGTGGTVTVRLHGQG